MSREFKRFLCWDDFPDPLMTLDRPAAGWSLQRSGGSLEKVLWGWLTSEAGMLARVMGGGLRGVGGQLSIPQGRGWGLSTLPLLLKRFSNPLAACAALALTPGKLILILGSFATAPDCFILNESLVLSIVSSCTTFVCFL